MQIVSNVKELWQTGRFACGISPGVCILAISGLIGGMQIGAAINTVAVAEHVECRVQDPGVNGTNVVVKLECRPSTGVVTSYVRHAETVVKILSLHPVTIRCDLVGTGRAENCVVGPAE